MRRPRLFTIEPGVPFLDELARSLKDGRLVPGFSPGEDPLALAAATIYVPTRRAARELRAIFAGLGGTASILPAIRPLGEFDEDAAIFEDDFAGLPELAPPVSALDRILMLAPLVRRWKLNLPAHVAQLFGGDDIVAPASHADAIWLARDLGELIDSAETEGVSFAGLGKLAPDDLARWWQVTLEFLRIVTEHWPDMLAEKGFSNPAAHRNALIDAETARLRRNPPAGPVIAAGSTGSIPATARLLSAISRLEQGTVVLPGLDLNLDEAGWAAAARADPMAADFNHPQAGLARLLRALGASRDEVERLGEPSPKLAARQQIVSLALRPAETTDLWQSERPSEAALQAGLADVGLMEAANEREEALAIAVALRAAIATPGRRAALVTGDRALARRVSAEMTRFGVTADDSAGRPLSATPPATLLRMLVGAAFAPSDPLPIASLLQHPLLHLGQDRAALRGMAELFELAALRGGTGRPDIAALPALLDQRLDAIATAPFEPFWTPRLDAARIAAMRDLARALAAAVAPLTALRNEREATLTDLATASVTVLEAAGREASGALDGLYRGEAGERLAEFLRGLIASGAQTLLPPREWPDVLAALMATEMVKPRPGPDQGVFIWGQLEARLQPVDLMVLGGLNEGNWPRSVEAGRFLSRMMAGALGLEPPERRTGQSAHDFEMAMGAPEILLSRALRADNAPSVASRWLQRLTVLAGDRATAMMRRRGAEILHWAASLDDAPRKPFAERPEPKPPLDKRPQRFSVTEIEVLRRDPYAIHARRILGLKPVEPLLRDPGAAERGNLFHDILHRFTIAGGIDVPDAEARLQAIGRQAFDELALPVDIEAVWWPRFLAMMPEILEWERNRNQSGMRRFAEVSAVATPIGLTSATLSGRADRIDLFSDGRAAILDYKTGSQPSVTQARALLAPQLPLEGALLMRGAFGDIGTARIADLAYVRLRARGQVAHESLGGKNAKFDVAELSETAWTRMEELVAAYADPARGYMSRVLPMREGDTEGDYDHLARVLEWSAGVSDETGEDTE